MRLQAAFARKFCGPFSAQGSAAGAAPGRFRGTMLCHTTRRLAQTEGPYGFSAGVKQIAHFQNNNLSTFKIQCVQALHSSNCLHTWNRANADELCKACTVAFCTMYGQKSRCVQDHAALPSHCTGAKKDRLRAVRGRPFSAPVYFFFCCSCSLRSSLMRFFSLLTWGHGQLKPSLALHQRVSG